LLDRGPSGPLMIFAGTAPLRGAPHVVFRTALPRPRRALRSARSSVSSASICRRRSVTFG